MFRRGRHHPGIQNQNLLVWNFLAGSPLQPCTNGPFVDDDLLLMISHANTAYDIVFLEKVAEKSAARSY